MTNIVITMAGQGSRFYQAGYTTPKYAIQAHGLSLFEWSMLSLKNLVKSDDRIIFVCLARNNSSEFVKAACASMGYTNVVIHELDGLTDGQATSAYSSRCHWALQEPLLVYNIDTYVEPQFLKPESIRESSDGWIPCFQAAGDHWSFVRLGESGWASEVAEKTRISQYASIGLYWFASAETYIKAYATFFSDTTTLVNGEKYIAPLYTHLIENGLKVSIADIPPEAIHVLGTPSELATFSSADIT